MAKAGWSPRPLDWTSQNWLALNIGNSYLHWAWWQGETLQFTWQTPHQSGNPEPAFSQENPSNSLAILEALLATAQLPDRLVDRGYSLLQKHPETLPVLHMVSGVPEQAQRFQAYPHLEIVTLDQIPLQATYATLGVDRALALWGAGEIYGWPVLVIDAGTALTLTGADADQCLIGGAILPGVGLQLRSLEQFTAALPGVSYPSQLPQRWATTTPEAIQSGVIYTLLAGVREFIYNWRQQFPTSPIVITGGDRPILVENLHSNQTPGIAAGNNPLISEPDLIFKGMALLRRHRLQINNTIE